MEACKYTNKLSSWPLDWDRHITQGFELFFQKTDKNNINHLLTDMTFFAFSNPIFEKKDIDSTEIKILLECEDSLYVAWIFRGDPSTNEIVTNVFKCFDLVHDMGEAMLIKNKEDMRDPDSAHIFQIGHSIAVGKSIHLVSCSSVYESIQGVKRSILDDFWGKDGDDNGSDDSPIFPFVPTGGNLLFA